MFKKISPKDESVAEWIARVADCAFLKSQAYGKVGCDECEKR